MINLDFKKPYIPRIKSFPDAKYYVWLYMYYGAIFLSSMLSHFTLATKPPTSMDFFR